MDLLSDIFKLFAGTGLFLFAMYLIEESLKNLSGRNFKIFLQRVTKTSLGAVGGGAVVTSILQSSSMVSLMVLAFVGAGVFTMRNAMAIILGANLGTTLSNWVVATLGFKVNIEVAAYPAVFAGALLLILSGSRKPYKYISYFLFGFGLLFIALSFMKTAMEAQVKAFDFSQYADMSSVVFLLIGFIITFLVQSSSVTMALTLSALHAGAITFPAAAAIVLGSETGTTIKILLGSMGGTASKKRVALGNILFNLFLTTGAFILLKPILSLITDILVINDPLIGLVTFSSLINLVSIAVFVPFLGPYARLLEKFFKDSDASSAAFITQANVAEPETAIDMFRKETEYFIYNSLLFNSTLFDMDTPSSKEHPEFKALNEKRKFNSKSHEEKYEFLRELQGELQAFYTDLRTKVEDKQLAELSLLVSAVRSAMYSAKSLKDVGNDLDNLKRSSKDLKFGFFKQHKKETEAFYSQLNVLVTHKKKAGFEQFQEIYNNVHENYSHALNNFYKEAKDAPLEDTDFTIALNFNRELFTSNKAMLMAVKDLLLEEKAAKDFNDIPVYHT